MINIFAYGTLKEPFILRALCINQFFVSGQLAEVDGVLYNLGQFPALVKEKGTVKGILLTFKDNPEVLSQLDKYEGSGRLYERVEITARVPLPTPFEGPKGPVTFKEVSCWAYVASAALKKEIKERNIKIINSGEWSCTFGL